MEQSGLKLLPTSDAHVAGSGFTHNTTVLHPKTLFYFYNCLMNILSPYLMMELKHCCKIICTMFPVRLGPSMQASPGSMLEMQNLGGGHWHIFKTSLEMPTFLTRVSGFSPGSSSHSSFFPTCILGGSKWRLMREALMEFWATHFNQACSWLLWTFWE